MTSSEGLQLFRSTQPARFDAGDAELAVFTFGSGPPLLMIHGWPLSSLTWRHVVPELARHFTCVVVDQAGGGASAWRAGTDFTFLGHAKRLQKLVENRGWKELAILAQDTGATVARQLALLENARVKKLVMINTEIPHHRPPWIQMFQVGSRLPLAELSFRTLLSSRAFRHSGMGFGGCFVDHALIDGEFTECFVQPLLSSKERLEGQLKYLQGITWPFVDALAELHGQIDAEVLFLWGADDPTFPLDDGKRMSTQLRNLRGFHAVPGAKLLVHEEKPAVVVEQTRAFLA